MSTLTPNYEFILPEVNDPVDEDLWGGYLNANFGEIDTLIKSLNRVGKIEPCLDATAPSTWLFSNGLTIGNAASSATSRANADTEALFTFLYNNLDDAEATVSGGRVTDAATDYAANKTITLPDMRGRGAIGADDMGTTAANRLTSAISGVDGLTVGSTGGDQRLHQHTHTATQSAHTHTYNSSSGNGATPSGGSAHTLNTATATTSAQPAITVANEGDGGSENVHPVIVTNWIIKL